MGILGFSRYALTISAAAAMLAGCGGSQPPVGAPGALPQASAIANHHLKGKSGSGDLIYAASNGVSYVFTYPAGKLVGSINFGAQDICSDNSGNVYLPVDTNIYEFSHGATKPTATLNVLGAGRGCAVDPSSGNLAVTFYPASGSDVAIFHNGQVSYYNMEPSPQYCGYDNEGNLFLDYPTNDGSLGFVELPAGESQFQTITITPPLNNNALGRIQWDGTYLTLESGIKRHRAPHVQQIDRLSISGSTATVVGITNLRGIRRAATLSWIYDGAVIVPFGNAGNLSRNLGYWKYPKGGKPATTIKNPVGQTLNALTISVAP